MRLIDANAIQYTDLNGDHPESKVRVYVAFKENIDRMPTVDAVPVRCKDCKHKPTGTNRDDLEFPDDKCPSQCEDYWYSWKPSDDWFCGNGERKDGDDDD